MIRSLQITILLLAFFSLQPPCFAGVTVFAGSASKPPLEEAAELYRSETGIEIVLHFGGSGAMLNQLRLSKKADLFIPGSPDFMLKAQRFKLVDSSTEKVLAYLVPAINVLKGNPKNIHGLADLGRPGIRVGIADPSGVCVGLYAVEIIEAQNLDKLIRPNITANVESCAKTAALIPLQSVDATLGWREFEQWNPDQIESILLPPEQIVRLAYIPAAIATHARNIAEATRFLTFLTSPRATAIFAKWGYLTSEEQARVYAPYARIGGEYRLPEGW